MINMMETLARASEKRPKVVVLVVALVTIAMIYGASNLTMSTETEAFLPEDYTSVRVTNILENRGEDSINEILLVEGGDLTSADSFRLLFELQQSLLQDPSFENYISRIQSYPSYLVPNIEEQVDNWRSLSDSQLEAVIDQLIQRSEIKQQINAFLSENRDATLIVLSLNGQLPLSELYEGTEELRDFSEQFNKNNEALKSGVTGSISMELDTQGMMNRDNQILIPAAIVLIIIILYFAFRRFSDVGLPFLVLGLGAIWMVGAMGYLGISFNMIYVALVPIILGVGIDYTIHMLNRYYEERGKGIAVEKSALTSVRNVGVAILLTAVTTIIGFSSFGISDMPPIRDFGFLAAGGVFFIFILAMTLLPSLLVLRDRGGEEEIRDRGERREDKVGKALSKLEMGVQSHGKSILVIAGVVTVLAVVPALGVTTTMSFDMFLPSGIDSVETMNKVETYFGGQGGFSEDYVLVQGDVTSPQSLEEMYSLQNSVLSDPESEGLIIRSSSLADLILYSTGGDMPQTKEQVEMILASLRAERPEQLDRFLITEDKAVVRFSMSAETDKEMEEATNIIRAHVRQLSGQQTELDYTLDGEPAVGGPPAIISDIMGSIEPSMRNSILLAIILVVVVLSLVFRSIFVGIVGAIPVSIALVWELGTLGCLGWSLDVMNMMVSALAIGIGVDFAIHITHRFQEEWKNNGKSPEEAISITIQSVGRAITAAAATTIGVFVVLSLSRMPPIARFGQISALVIFFSLVGALLILPSALLAYARWKGE